MPPDHGPHHKCEAASDTVRGKVYLQHIIILNLEILSGRTAHKSLRFGRKNYDSVVRIAHADFVLGTYHTERLDTANLRFLDFNDDPSGP